MRVYRTTILLLACLGGCSGRSDSQKYSVYFEPYSAELDRHGRETIDAAAAFARSHPLQPVAVDGFAAPPDPQRDVDGLSAQRAEVVKRALVVDGVGAARITTVANGITDPKSLPSVAVRRVDIGIGQ
jgi:outer membrane protein OmpA-like peptidoglycan-associated protein